MPETLKELTTMLRDMQEEVAIIADLELDSEDLTKALDVLKAKIVQKVDAIDHVVVSFEAMQDRLLSLAEIYENEAKILKRKAESVSKHREGLLQYLADTGLITKDKPLRTGAHTYFIQTINESLKIEDDAVIPDEYIKTKIEQVIDRASLRSDIISGKLYVKGISVPKRERVSKR